MLVALDDHVKENGPTEFFPKSHHQCCNKDKSDFYEGGSMLLTECPWVKERLVVTGERGTIIFSIIEYYTKEDLMKQTSQGDWCISHGCVNGGWTVLTRTRSIQEVFITLLDLKCVSFYLELTRSIIIISLMMQFTSIVLISPEVSFTMIRTIMI